MKIRYNTYAKGDLGVANQLLLFNPLINKLNKQKKLGDHTGSSNEG